MLLPMRLLLVEDDPELRLALERSLTHAGMRVLACPDGEQALTAWQAREWDAVLLDLTLPGMDGLDVLQEARARGLLTPVVILTARGTVGDRVLGLNAGADDYLPKPFDLDELEARLRALHRRSQTRLGDPRMADGPSGGATFGPLRHDPVHGAMYLHGEVLELTPRELALLRALMERPGHAVAKERLFEVVFPGQSDVQYEAIEVVVYRLRKKLQGSGLALSTLRGLGYLLKLDS